MPIENIGQPVGTNIQKIGEVSVATLPVKEIAIGAVIGAIIIPIITGKASKTQIPIGIVIGAVAGYLVGRK